MSGKAYTMKEMKAIVDYLTERRAYAEIKGRKMWVDFEKSKFTDRTWQSLKETFLKRILPDIHNPYYKLSLVQVTSFRQGYDIEAKLNNKLEVKSINEGSSTDASQPKNTEQPSTSNNKDGEKESGEEQINSKTVSHHRASAETIILDSCYETADDIRKDLESPKQNTGVKDKEKSPTKTLKDFITYSEPLTPMLQEVIDDFATDEERDPSDDEPQMEIAEDMENDKDPKKQDQICDETVEISSGTDDVSNSNIDMEKEYKNDPDKKQETIEKDKPSQKNNTPADNPKTSSTQNINQVDDSEYGVNCSPQESNNDVNNKIKDLNEDPLQYKPEDNSEKATKTDPKEITSCNVESIPFSQNRCIENLSNTTTDSVIPNNQEALSRNSQPTYIDKVPKKEAASKDASEIPIKLSRKRANSQEVTASKQKKRSLASNSSKSVSASDTDASKKRDNKLKSNPKIDNLKETDLHTSEKVNETVSSNQKVAVEELPKEVAKNHVKEVINEEPNNQDIDNKPVKEAKHVDVSVTVNPCLKSVSLYDEQFSALRYSESSDDVKKCEGKKTSAPKKDSRENEIVSLKSNSEKEDYQPAKKKATLPRNVRSERDQTFANVFGFTSGAVTSSRKRRVSYQNKARRQSQNRPSSGSSEWTSDSDAEFVSPPRRTRHSRKYLKPKSARILSLEEEGGLFMMCGKKIYPLVKDGKLMKNLTYVPERDSEDEEESFWKLKYLEEKKRTAQLTKLLHQSSKDDQPPVEDSTSNYQKSNPKKRKITDNETEVQDKNTVQEVVPKDTQEPPKIVSNEVKTLKIKITKQNEEVQLEGHWSQIHPVLDQVVQIFHKEPKPTSPRESTISNPAPETQKPTSSGVSTPVIAVIDKEAHEKVNKIETEIFKEIEALDNEAVSSTPQSVLETETKVAKRRGRPRKSATPTESTPGAPEKRLKKMEPEKLPVQEAAEKLAPAKIENDISPVTRRTRTPKKVLHENTERNEGNVANTRTKRVKESIPVEPIDDDPNVRYKFPSPPPSGKKTRRSGANKSIQEQKTRNRFIKKKITMCSPPDIISTNSIESSQGYQDSDVSPDLTIRKKKYTATYNARGTFKRRSNLRRKTIWHLDTSDQSSNSCANLHNSESDQKSSSGIHRSESYDLLMVKNKNYLNNLERIDEVNLNHPNNSELLSRNANTSVKKADNFISNVNENKSNKTGDGTDADNSNTVSLPPSPVLSIVENISISNNELNSLRDNIDKENETDMNKAVSKDDFNIMEVDVTMPPLEQDCAFRSNIENVTAQRFDVDDEPPVLTESFVSKICSVKIHDNPTLSETMNIKLRNLLLGSAKKMANQCKDTEAKSSDMMEIDSVKIEGDKHAKPKKRCSTPLKRRNTRKRKVPEYIDEEHIIAYSKGDRRSCPPLMKITELPVNMDKSENVTGDAMKKKKGRKKKENVIKVKILRPTRKRYSKEKETQKEESLRGDSGINDTSSSVLCQGLDESVDLIHNHTETCLKANDCVGDSIEVIESTKSLISLDSNSDQSIQMEREYETNIDSGQNNQTELFQTLNHNKTTFQNALGMLRNNKEDNEGTSYHTPLKSEYSASSLITEDLSDADQRVDDIPSKPSKWYLLSEDETNTNFAFPDTSKNVSYGADLNQLFPITCAVPDLSTITEMSNDKALARASRNHSSSQSIIDNNVDSNF